MSVSLLDVALSNKFTTFYFLENISLKLCSNISQGQTIQSHFRLDLNNWTGSIMALNSNIQHRTWTLIYKCKPGEYYARYWLKNFITLLASYYIIGFITFKMAKIISLLAGIMLLVATVLICPVYLIQPCLVPAWMFTHYICNCCT